MTRKTKAIIHLDAIANNYHLTSQLAPESGNIPVIKADAYGHGSIQVALKLQAEAPAFAVAIIEEAISLREHGIHKPILVLQGISEAENLKYAAENNIWLMIHNQNQLGLILKNKQTTPLNIWLKLDTGMHRLGLIPEEVKPLFNQLSGCLWVKQPIVIASHFSCASAPGYKATTAQISEFTSIVSDLTQGQSNKPQVELSVANSAALISLPESRLDWNRPGIMLYGLSPFDFAQADACQVVSELQPAMTFCSSVIAIREIKAGESVGYGEQWTATRPSKIATIAVGYADGYPRHAKNGTPLLISGQKASLVGRVSMDMISADITDCEDISVGAVVELWGKNISADEIALYADTISYDLIAGVSPRVSREYQG